MAKGKLGARLGRLIKDIVTPTRRIREDYAAFKEVLAHDGACLELLTELEELGRTSALAGLSGGMTRRADWARIVTLTAELTAEARLLAEALVRMNPAAYGPLTPALEQVLARLEPALAGVGSRTGDAPIVLDLAEAQFHPQISGGKAANLSALTGLARGIPGVAVPPGFVLTTAAARRFLEHNALRERLNELLAQVEIREPEALEGLATEMQLAVMEAEVPEDVGEALLAAAEKLSQCDAQALSRGDAETRLALRSSAVAEDGERSFAGQHHSELGVAPDRPEHLRAAYKRVLASKYAPRAIVYRVLAGYADEETDMAVLLMPLVRARAAGVAYTADTGGAAQCGGATVDVGGDVGGDAGGDVGNDPGSVQETPLSVHAVSGLADELVSGRALAERHCFVREDDALYPLAATETSVLSAQEAHRVAELALAVEQARGDKPQDVEWALDAAGTLYLLQARDQRTEEAQADDQPTTLLEPGEEAALPVLLAGGDAASQGVAAGTAHLVKDWSSLAEIPEGAVAVVRGLNPCLTQAAPRIRAVVAEVGSRASHFASVARELGLPVIIGLSGALGAIPDGAEVTVLAVEGGGNEPKVLSGGLEALPERVRERLALAAREDGYAATPCGRRLKAILDVVSPLTFTDPASPEFRAENVASVHDTVRYAHEMAASEMFGLVGRAGRGVSGAGGARKLRTELPLPIYVLDLGGGLASEAGETGALEPAQVSCPPFTAVWQGLTDPAIPWLKGLTHVDWEEFDRVSGGIFKHDSTLLASYALVATDYLHLNFRFGYHFAVLDTVCGEESRQNHIRFRFKGGGGEDRQKTLRLSYLTQALALVGFSSEVRGDLLSAVLARETQEACLAALAQLGYLMGSTRMLDMALQTDDDVARLAAAFKARLTEGERS